MASESSGGMEDVAALLQHDVRDVDVQYKVRLSREVTYLSARALGSGAGASSSELYLYAEHTYLLRLVGHRLSKLHLRAVAFATGRRPETSKSISSFHLERVEVRREELVQIESKRGGVEVAYRLYVSASVATEILAACTGKGHPCFELALQEEHALCHGANLPRLRVHLMLPDMRATLNEAHSLSSGAHPSGHSVLRALWVRGKLGGEGSEPLSLCQYHRQARGECLLVAEKEAGGSTSVAIRVFDRHSGLLMREPILRLHGESVHVYGMATYDDHLYLLYTGSGQKMDMPATLLYLSRIPLICRERPVGGRSFLYPVPERSLLRDAVLEHVLFVEQAPLASVRKQASNLLLLPLGAGTTFKETGEPERQDLLLVFALNTHNPDASADRTRRLGGKILALRLSWLLTEGLSHRLSVLRWKDRRLQREALEWLWSTGQVFAHGLRMVSSLDVARSPSPLLGGVVQRRRDILETQLQEYHGSLTRLAARASGASDLRSARDLQLVVFHSGWASVQEILLLSHGVEYDVPRRYLRMNKERWLPLLRASGLWSAPGGMTLYRFYPSSSSSSSSPLQSTLRESSYAIQGGATLFQYAEEEGAGPAFLFASAGEDRLHVLRRDPSATGTGWHVHPMAKLPSHGRCVAICKDHTSYGTASSSPAHVFVLWSNGMVYQLMMASDRRGGHGSLSPAHASTLQHCDWSRRLAASGCTSAGGGAQDLFRHALLHPAGCKMRRLHARAQERPARLLSFEAPGTDHHGTHGHVSWKPAKAAPVLTSMRVTITVPRGRPGQTPAEVYAEMSEEQKMEVLRAAQEKACRAAEEAQALLKEHSEMTSTQHPGTLLEGKEAEEMLMVRQEASELTMRKIIHDETMGISEVTPPGQPVPANQVEFIQDDLTEPGEVSLVSLATHKSPFSEVTWKPETREERKEERRRAAIQLADDEKLEEEKRAAKEAEAAAEQEEAMEEAGLTMPIAADVPEEMEMVPVAELQAEAAAARMEELGEEEEQDEDEEEDESKLNPFQLEAKRDAEEEARVREQLYNEQAYAASQRVLEETPVEEPDIGDLEEIMSDQSELNRLSEQFLQDPRWDPSATRQQRLECLRHVLEGYRNLGEVKKGTCALLPAPLPREESELLAAPAPPPPLPPRTTTTPAPTAPLSPAELAEARRLLREAKPAPGSETTSTTTRQRGSTKTPPKQKPLSDVIAEAMLARRPFIEEQEREREEGEEESGTTTSATGRAAAEGGGSLSRKRGDNLSSRGLVEMG